MNKLQLAMEYARCDEGIKIYEGEDPSARGKEKIKKYRTEKARLEKELEIWFRPDGMDDDDWKTCLERGLYTRHMWPKGANT